MKEIENISQLNALITNTYVYAIILSIIALVLAYVIANIIKYQGGKKDKSNVKRRVWFIIIGIVIPILFYLYNYMFILSNIARPPLQARFLSTNLITSLLILFVFFAVGLITMVFLRRSKWGSIMGK